jgi:hypothetical protein
MAGFRFPLKMKFGLLLAGFVGAMAVVIAMSYNTSRDVSRRLHEIEFSALQQHSEAFHLIDTFKEVSRLLEEMIATGDLGLMQDIDRSRDLFLSHAERLVRTMPRNAPSEHRDLTEKFIEYHAAATQYARLSLARWALGGD